ncbi:class I SAM-dependent methyltransferase [Halobacillus yeomjeoni]|uniref:class I SAM-dependent methyltransferase n=1 Tax=Halobacillus yeomjeoni TaxID=311194 RepID=UPI001CD1BCCC|nr:class I SAM-dependent methyltransferase [Halobacillus yeomjeoni]MCA0983937.1 class I SAM-dependent methyltransferase [Halobacillus yeomjeoni]
MANYEIIKKQLADAYNNQADNRNESSIQTWKVFERQDFLNRLLHNGKTNVLELGAGPGKDSKFFQDSGLDVLAIDLSPEMVQKCKEKGLKAEVMSFDELSFEENTFSGVWALNTLLHVPKDNITAVLNDIKRVLEPEGLFYFGVYGGIDHEGVWEKDFHSPKRFFSFYQDEEIERILSEHFKIDAFHKIPIKHEDGGPTHFQGFILKK